MDWLDRESAEAMAVLENGSAPKLYALNLDSPSSLGNCPENGSILCPECFGLWAPEHMVRAVLHVSQGRCDRINREDTARRVPLRPENMKPVIDLKFNPMFFEVFRWWY